VAVEETEEPLQIVLLCLGSLEELLVQVEELADLVEVLEVQYLAVLQKQLFVIIIEEIMGLQALHLVVAVVAAAAEDKAPTEE
jgi:hypothetical protein